MLDKKFTMSLRAIFQFIFLSIIFLVLVAANVDNYNQKKMKAEHEHWTQYDSINKRVAELEAELKAIMEDNRLCAIIGAYTIINQPVVKPTVENVEALVLLCDCWYPDIIMAQYQLESTKGTSSLARHNNNLFGMTKAFTRKSVRCRSFDSKGYAMYNNWQLSVIDRIYWEEHAFPDGKPTRKEYLEKIRRTYAKDSSYIQKITSIAKDYSYLIEEES